MRRGQSPGRSGTDDVIAVSRKKSEQNTARIQYVKRRLYKLIPEQCLS
jgi:hypothetical protein